MNIDKRIQNALFRLIFILPAISVLAPLRVAQAEATNEVGSSAKRIVIRPFDGGDQVVGVGMSPPRSASRSDAPQIKADLPHWLKQEELLGEFSESATRIRLYWNHGGTVPLNSKRAKYLLRIANHQGYAVPILPQEGYLAAGLYDEATKSAYADYNFAELRGYPPGLYNLLLSTEQIEPERRPLGQVLWSGQAVTRDQTVTQAATMFENADVVFGGTAVLARWYRLELPVSVSRFKPTKIFVVTSVDWLENSVDATAVAGIRVTSGNETIDCGQLALGRDTASTWYDFHARGSIKHRKAQVAWSWRERQDAIDFESCAYFSQFNLPRNGIDRVTVRFLGDEGVLRIYAIVLAP